MIRSRDYLAMVLSVRLCDDRFEAYADFPMTLIEVFAGSPIGQQGTGVDGPPEQVNRALFVQSGVEVMLLLSLVQLAGSAQGTLKVETRGSSGSFARAEARAWGIFI